MLADWFSTWNEWEVHQRVCCLVDGVQKYCPENMTRLRLHDYAPYRSLFSTDATAWPRIKEVEIGLYSWMEERRDRDVIGPIPYRITQGHHHREEEEAFDDKTFDGCGRDHMSLGNHVVQGVGASFEDLLQSLQTISKKYPNIKIKPINSLRNITLHPFHLVNVTIRRHHFGQNALQNSQQASTDPTSKPEVQSALRWLAHECDWKPIFVWDTMMCDVFPTNLEQNRTFLPKADVLARIQNMVSTLRTLQIPIRICIGDRANTSPPSSIDGCLYFGDSKGHIGEGENKREVILPAQAIFSLTPIASMVDELTIHYPSDAPGVSGFLRSAKRPTPTEKALMQREMVGWRRFWTRYASQFKNLKKLTTNVPNDIYEDWGKGEMATLLADQRWQMLEVEEQQEQTFFGSNFPFNVSSARYRFPRSRNRGKFVQRVFFRLDDEPLDLAVPHPGLTPQELEEREITDEEITYKEDEDGSVTTHRFWVKKEEMMKEEGDAKRKREDNSESVDGETLAEEVEAKRRRLQSEVRAGLEDLTGV